MPVDVKNLLCDISTIYDELKESFVIPSEPDNPIYVQVIMKKEIKSKSTADANSFRTRGNEQYQRKEFEQALESYTNSLIASLEDSRECALAYANRSAVFFAQQKYVPCLLDVNRALKGDYPNDKREKLQKRKKKCLAHIMNRSDLNAGRIKGNETDPVVDDDDEWRSISKFDNPLIPNTSSKIKLECNELKGRHMVATEDIEPGELLSTEKCFSTDVRCDGLQKNCSHCLTACAALIPCPKCVWVLYCSERCRTRAYNSYHRIECQMWPFYIHEAASLLHRVAIRTLLIGTEQGAKLEDLMNAFTIESIFTEEPNPANRPFINDYRASLTLCRTFDQAILKSLLHVSVKTVIALQGLSFFNTNASSKVHSREILFSTALLMNHGYTLGRNEFRYTLELEKIKTRVFGQRFLHTFVNHSCNANVFGIMHKREHAIFASRPIKKGDEIVMNLLCGSFTQVPKRQRQRAVSTFHNFKCQCEACDKNWPLLNDLVDRKITYIVGNEKKLMRDLQNMAAPLFNGGIEKLEDAEILQNLINVIKLFYVRTKPPSWPLVFSEMLFKLLITLLYDDLTLVERAGDQEKALLDDNKENVEEIEPTNPNVHLDMVKLVNSLEKLYLNIRKRFASEN